MVAVYSFVSMRTNRNSARTRSQQSARANLTSVSRRDNDHAAGLRQDVHFLCGPAQSPDSDGSSENLFQSGNGARLSARRLSKPDVPPELPHNSPPLWQG